MADPSMNVPDDLQPSVTAAPAGARPGLVGPPRRRRPPRPGRAAAAPSTWTAWPSSTPSATAPTRSPIVGASSRSPIVPADAPDNAAMRAAGEEALRRGEVAVLVVAGGQGSRLGFEHPKGMYPVGPVSRKSLFQIHAEKVLALGRRYGQQPPLLVMTSPATDAETKEFFAEQRYFGLPKEEVFFFCQGTMPALDLATGKLLLEAPGRLFLSPDGHGGTLTALAKSGLLERLQRARHPPPVLLPGGQPAREGGRPDLPGPPPVAALRGVVQDRAQAGAEGPAGQPRAGRGPLYHDRVFRPARQRWPTRRTRTAGCVCGQAARRSTSSTWISWPG